MMVVSPAAAQDPIEDSIDSLDEVIATGTLQRDPAMSAYFSGDFETAEIEFERNAFCALRATRNFRAGVDDARDSTVRADVGTSADVAAQPTGNPGSGGNISVQATPSVLPSASINSSDFEKNDSETSRTCADRGFQLYMAGLSQIKLGKFDDAKKSFESAVVIRKSIYDAHFRLALLEIQDGNIKKAHKQLKQLKRLEKRCRRCEHRDEITQQVKYLENILG